MIAKDEVRRAVSSPVRVLAAVCDPATLRTIERAIAMNGDELVFAMDVAEALAMAVSEHPDLALVDVTLEGRAGLALVHHLPAVCAELPVYALTPSGELDLGTQALALGAVGLLISPPSGDGILRAVGEVRARRAETKERARLVADLALEKRRGELLAAVVNLLEAGEHAKAAGLVADALSDASGASGAAIYATTDGKAHERVRLAAVGSADAEDAPRSGEAESGARVVPLSLGERVVGYAMLDHARLADLASLKPLTEVAAAVLVLSSVPRGDASVSVRTASGRIYSGSFFESTASREIDIAKRHGRRLAIACIRADAAVAAQSERVEDIVLGAVRETDVLARREPGEFLLLMPETGALGAHACRRRVLVRAEGDRRAKTPPGDRRGPVAARPSRGVPLSIGIASYPHDGNDLERLVQCARRRADDAARSVVHGLSLASKSLPEIIDALLEAPASTIGLASTQSLDISLPAALSLVAAACVESRRGGGATILVTTQAGAGFVTVVRATLPREGGSVTVHAVDVQKTPGFETADALVVVAEHGTWALCGRRVDTRFKAVHSADPLLADLVAQRLAQAAGVRLG